MADLAFLLGLFIAVAFFTGLVMAPWLVFVFVGFEAAIVVALCILILGAVLG